MGEEFEMLEAGKSAFTEDLTVQRFDDVTSASHVRPAAMPGSEGHVEAGFTPPELPIPASD